MNLQVQNLLRFNQIAAGVDDDTWLYHLQRGDFSRWFAECLRDEDLAAETKKVEQQQRPSAEQTRRMVRELIESRYTLPASAPIPLPGTAAPLAGGEADGE